MFFRTGEKVEVNFIHYTEFEEQIKLFRIQKLKKQRKRLLGFNVTVHVPTRFVKVNIG